jgi:hypothetical protein
VQFVILAAIVAVSGFAGGVVSERVFAVKNARAQEAAHEAHEHGSMTPMTSINVGSAGLVFRGPNGRVIAKLSSEATGGVFELYNANEQPGARLSASSPNGDIDLLARDPIRVPSPNAPPGRDMTLALDPGF